MSDSNYNSYQHNNRSIYDHELGLDNNRIDNNNENNNENDVIMIESKTQYSSLCHFITFIMLISSIVSIGLMSKSFIVYSFDSKIILYRVYIPFCFFVNRFFHRIYGRIDIDFRWSNAEGGGHTPIDLTPCAPPLPLHRKIDLPPSFTNRQAKCYIHTMMDPF